MKLTDNPIKRLLIGLIRIYQKAVSPWLAPSCRFYPSCSEYAVEAIKYFGVMRGTYLMLRRLLKCHPWGSFGVDSLPEKTKRV